MAGQVGYHAPRACALGRPVSVMDVLPKLSERGWQQDVLKLARMFGWRWWHDVATNAPRACRHCKKPLSLPRNDAGWPDLFMVRGDTLIVAELKSDRNYPTADQRAWLDAFRNVRRIVVVVWKPRDAQKVAEVLR
jgi:hypothetical protein